MKRFSLSPLTLRFHSASRSHRQLRAAVVLAATLCTAAAPTLAQDAAEANQRRRRAAQDEAAAERPGRGNFNPEEMQTRLLSTLRERLEITDDEEWKLISERIAAVNEARRTAGGGGGMGAAMMAGARGGGGGQGRGGRGGTNSDLAALQAAVRDKAPDAEIKARLDRVREQRKLEEAKLLKAQEELRAVLTVRQEATAVVFGLLP